MSLHHIFNMQIYWSIPGVDASEQWYPKRVRYYITSKGNFLVIPRILIKVDVYFFLFDFKN